MKKLYVLFILAMGFAPALLAQTIEECEATRKSTWPAHYCHCEVGHTEFTTLPLDTVVSDSIWYMGDIDGFSEGITAYIYGDAGVHISLYLNCKSKKVLSKEGIFEGSIDVEPNQIWDISQESLITKLQEAGVSGKVRMCVYPLEPGKEARLFCNPYNKGPHSTCEDLLPAIPGMTFVSSHADDVYVLRRQDIPAEGTMLVSWFKHNGAACQMTIKRGSCHGEVLAEVDLTSQYEITRELLDGNEDLYLQLAHAENTAGRVLLTVKEPTSNPTTGCDDVTAPAVKARLVMGSDGVLYIERGNERYSLTGGKL